ncbi:MAG: carbohydrate binding family 9 domain-containing protein [Bacteroidetes bacterium]|nr:carbohydrate binding family 9 domain-containing protein [Bacteroidota bacterium]
MILKLIHVLFVILLLTARSAFSKADHTVEPPSTTANFSTEAPVIDGEVINDPFWKLIQPIGDLVQAEPNSGQPASLSTEIRLTYTVDTFFLSVICYDPDPDGLVVSDTRRDADLKNTDAFLFILDTYDDKQNGFLFGTNSAGIEYDAQVDNEGQGNFGSSRQRGGAIGGFNLNWDGSWKVKTQVGDYGWSAEFAIPLKTLRFNSGQGQSWGANFQRIIREPNEIDYWAPIPIDSDIKRLSLAGTLTGLDLQSPGNLKIIPYILGGIERDYEAGDETVDVHLEFGVDVKYSITSSMTLDLTYNTDFAQVEVDEQQVNLDRFNLFFPEKRAFFLENAGLFSVGSPGEVDLFFSRRIGIGEDGRLVPIIGGTRVSGKLNNTSIGLLSMFTEEVNYSEDGETQRIEPNNFSVVRINHQLAQRSTVGGVVVSRYGLGDTEDDYNVTYAVDSKIGLGKKGQVTGFYAKSETPGIELEDHSFQLKADYIWNGLRLNAGYTKVGEGFNPEVGFLKRSAYWKPQFLVFQQIRMDGKLGLFEIRPHVSYHSYWNFDGFQETSFLHIDNHWEWLSGFEVHTAYNITSEGVVEEFNIYESGSDSVVIEPGTYDHQETFIVLLTNQSKPVYLRGRSVYGGFFGGMRLGNTLTLGIRAGNRFTSEFTYMRNDVNLENGSFKTHILQGRLTYSFTTKMFTQALIQYNSVTDTWSANVRFSLLTKANTGLFLVLNETRTSTGTLNHGVFLKYSYMFDVLK